MQLNYAEQADASANMACQLRAVAGRYPQPVITLQIRDIDRVVFQVDLIQRRCGSDISVCDIGAGIGLFPIACALAGMNVTLVDDFSDPVNAEYDSQVLPIHRSFGISVISRDVIRDGIDFPHESFDVITSIDSMEHWHHSPKRLFASIRETLKPGGMFVLGTPNAVNLRKRITVPLGIGKWSQMRDWYEQEVFRGHVREPDVADLLYIARDMQLDDVQIIGRNWIVYKHSNNLVRLAGPFLDRLLQPFPSLCSDLYMSGIVRK